jgi:hypothetical protein
VLIDVKPADKGNTMLVKGEPIRVPSEGSADKAAANQHLTRAQLYDHIKRDCPEVPIMCQVCNKEYPRAEFANHQCIKEFYVEKLTTYNYDVLIKLVDKLILHRR